MEVRFQLVGAEGEPQHTDIKETENTEAARTFAPCSSRRRWASPWQPAAQQDLGQTRKIVSVKQFLKLSRLLTVFIGTELLEHPLGVKAVQLGSNAEHENAQVVQVQPGQVTGPAGRRLTHRVPPRTLHLQLVLPEETRAPSLRAAESDLSCGHHLKTNSVGPERSDSRDVLRGEGDGTGPGGSLVPGPAQGVVGV